MVSRDLTQWSRRFSCKGAYIRFLNGPIPRSRFENIYASINGLDWTNVATDNKPDSWKSGLRQRKFHCRRLWRIRDELAGSCRLERNRRDDRGAYTQDVSFGSGIFVAVGDGE